MRPDKKTKGLVLESYKEQRTTYIAARISGRRAVAHFIREKGWTGEVLTTPKRHQVRFRPMRPIEVQELHPSEVTQIQNPSTPVELLLPQALLGQAIIALGNLVTMKNPMITRIRGIEPGEASQMLSTYWQQIPNEDTML